jgi:hypothetical protein
MDMRATSTPSPPSFTLHLEAMQLVAARSRAMPMPTSQRPSRTWPGCGLRRSQPKRSAPSLQAGTSCRVENGTCFSGSSLRLVADAQLDRVEPSFCASSSIAHAPAPACRPPRRARGTSRPRQVELDQRCVVMRLARRRASASADSPAPELSSRAVCDQARGRSPSACRRRSRPAAALHRVAAVRGDVEHLLARQRRLHRPLQLPRGQADSITSPYTGSLPPKPPPM